MDKARRTNLTRDELTKLGYVDTTAKQASMSGHTEEVPEQQDNEGDGDAAGPSKMVGPGKKGVSVSDLRETLLPPIYTALGVALSREGKLAEADRKQADYWMNLIDKYIQDIDTFELETSLVFSIS